MAGTSMAGGGQKKKARIEIIPLIDVIFFLLATFVLFTLSLNKTEGVKVLLPITTTAEPRDTANTATVTVTEQGTLAWNKDFVDLNEFLNRLKAFKQTNPDGRILINGDDNALFNSAIYVFDEARKAGFEKILVETKVKAPGKA
jgi:biopolymer transport protein ExbD